MGYYDSYDYMYDYGSSMDSLGITILVVYLGILMVFGLFALAGYILKGIGMYTMAKREGAEYPWLAFVPFARTYLQGELGGKIVLKKKSIQNPGVWLLALPIVEGAVVFIMYIVTFGIIGFSAIRYSSSGYYGSGMSAGTIVVMIVLLIIFMLVLVLFSAVLQVLRILVNHQIMGKFTSSNMSIVHAVLMGIIPLYEPICFLVMSRKPYNPGMAPSGESPFQAPPEGTDPYIGGPAPVMPEGPVQPPHDVQSETGFVPQRGLLNPVQPEAGTQETVKDTEPEAATQETVKSAEPEAATQETVKSAEPETATQETVKDAELEAVTQETVKSAEPEAGTQETVKDTEPETATQETVKDTEPELAERE